MTSEEGTRRAPIYLDYNASTPIAPEVAASMRPYLDAHFGNPSARHWAASGARDGIAKARAQVASRLGAKPSSVVFTSGGTESNNAAITGAFFPRYFAGKSFHWITSAVEHPSVLQSAGFLTRLGAEVTMVPVDRFGSVDPNDVRKALRSDTALVSVMHANNEVGTIQPVAAIAEIARTHGALMHSDAAQSIGKVPVDVERLGVDLLSVAGHKCYAPKGVGALFVRDGVALEPFLHGGGHEAGRRSGTENALFIAGLGAACEFCEPDAFDAVKTLRDRFHQTLNRGSDALVLNGHPDDRLPNTLNVSFPGKEASVVLESLPELAASTGSACHTGEREVSPVLKAMGVSVEVAMGALRLSLGRGTTRAEVDRAGELLVDAFHSA